MSGVIYEGGKEIHLKSPPALDHTELVLTCAWSTPERDACSIVRPCVCEGHHPFLQYPLFYNF